MIRGAARPSVPTTVRVALALLAIACVPAFGDEVNLSRYIVVAGPAQVGVVQPLTHSAVTSLCRDPDGCEMLVQMLDNFVSQPGNVTGTSRRLYLSETSLWWKLSDDEALGLDDNDAISQWLFFDCLFTDAETDAGSSNLVSDAMEGFGLLNRTGGASNETTTCRIVLTD